MLKFIALAGALVTGGTVALNTELETEVTEEEPTVEVEETTKPDHRRKGPSLEEVRASGLPYLKDEHLELLTEEQAFEVTSFIDQVNATYDFASMDDEELKETLESIKEEMKTLFDELGIERPERPERPAFDGEGRPGRRHKRLKGDNPVEETTEDSSEDSEL